MNTHAVAGKQAEMIAEHCARLLRAAPRGPAEVVYATDAADRIAFVEPEGWAAFAVENEAPEIAPGQSILGRTLGEFISGQGARLLHVAVLERLLVSESPLVEYPYRCDGPALERDMRMRMLRLGSAGDPDGVLYRSEVVATRERPPFRGLERGAATADLPLVTVCSYCKDVHHPETERWCSTGEYLEAGGSMDVRLSHGVCPKCFAAVLASFETARAG